MSKTFLKMTPSERETDLAFLEKGISFEQTRPLSPKGKALWELAKRGPGRPAKRPGEKAVRFLVSMDPNLLTIVDAYASAAGLDRSRLVALSLRAFLAADPAHRQALSARRDTRDRPLHRSHKRAGASQIGQRVAS